MCIMSQPASPRLPFDLLPDDILRLVFVDWIDAQDFETISKLEVALCNSVLSPWLKGFSPSLSFRKIASKFWKYIRDTGRMDIQEDAIRWAAVRKLRLEVWELDLGRIQQFETLGSLEYIMSSVQQLSIYERAVIEDVDSFRLDILSRMVSKCLQLSSLNLSWTSANSWRLIPWDRLPQLESLTSLQISIPLYEISMIDVCKFPTQRWHTLKKLSIEGMFHWNSLENFLSSFPNLEMLSVPEIPPSALPRSDSDISLDPLLLHLKELRTRSELVVNLYLLRQCPTITTVSIEHGSDDLFSILFSPSYPNLCSLTCSLHTNSRASICLHFNINHVTPFGVTWQAQVEHNDPQTMVWQSFLLTLQELSFNEPDSKFKLSIHFNQEGVRLLHLHSSGLAEELLQLFTIPGLRELNIQACFQVRILEYAFVFLKLLPACCDMRATRGIALPETLETLVFNGAMANTSIGSLLQLTPHLKTLSLCNCLVNLGAVVLIVACLPQLTRLQIRTVFRRSAVSNSDVSHKKVQVPHRNQSVHVRVEVNCISSWNELRATVSTLGPALGRLVVEDVELDHFLCVERDVEFLEKNRHVIFRFAL